jgi:hypothetical protein
MEIPPKVLARLIVEWLDDHHHRDMADWLRDQALDVWAGEADAIADARQALYLMRECLTPEQTFVASDEIIDRSAGAENTRS